MENAYIYCRVVNPPPAVRYKFRGCFNTWGLRFVGIETPLADAVSMRLWKIAPMALR